MVSVNTSEFLTHGKIGVIVLGMNANTVKEVLGEPDNVGGESRKYKWPNIWLYGDFQLIFDKVERKLNMIVVEFDCGNEPISGGHAFKLTPVFIRKGLSTEDIMTFLSSEGIDFQEVKPLEEGTSRLKVGRTTFIFDDTQGKDFGLVHMSVSSSDY